MKLLPFFAIISLSIVFIGCQKEKMDTKDVFGIEDPNITVPSENYSVNIIKALEKSSDYQFYTSGILEYTSNGNVIATVDFGDGVKDSWAKKVVNGKEESLDLTHKGKKSAYDKIIVNPLVKSNTCDYIVQGTIEYWQKGSWVATIDYGDGTCDDLATKTWLGGSKTFSLAK